MSNPIIPLTTVSYNCRGFNSTKSQYILTLLSKSNILFLQEHWLSEAQLCLLGNISSNISYTGISGFDNSRILAGRPFGGCAILWHSNILANVRPLDLNNNRVCAVLVCTESVKLLFINVYMPYEDGDDKIDELVSILSVIEDLIETNSDCHIVLGGDFNVDFSRDWTHTALLNSFCDNIGLSPILRHAKCTFDYTYNFNMSRFNILDHFILSGTLFDACVSDASVLHDVDNISDHDPIFLDLSINVESVALSKRAFAPHVSWVKASDKDLDNYRINLSKNLKNIILPTAALLCTDLCCTNPDHHSAICKYTEAITNCCLSAAECSIPHTSNRHAEAARVPGWTEHVKPLHDDSLFWHAMWIDCGRPKTGVVPDVMRRTRAKYHYAIRQIKRDEDNIVRERIANALINDPTRNFWDEVKKIRNSKASNPRIVDGCSDESSIARLFAQNYRSLYTSVPFDTIEMQNIRSELDGAISECEFTNFNIFNCQDIMTAISKLKLHKNDGYRGLSTDHFLFAGPELSVNIGFLFTCMVTHGTAPNDFGISTLIPIPKKHGLSATDSNNFRGIALSSVFCKLFDNVIMDKFYDKLCTSDLQFGFKKNSSTNMCTMILKESIAYYVNNRSSVFCTFLDASKAFDRVNYCKLFRLLIKRSIPACIVRILVYLYTGSQVRVLWAGLTSDYFTVLNGVKQGGVISPILYCIYTDDLLIRLSLSGVGCYIGLNFVGALAYADDIVLIAPTPSAMRKMLAICDAYAVEFDILFNAAKSKFLVIVSNKRRFLFSDMCKCNFKIGDKIIENVDKYSHLGHLITTRFDDDDDILFRRNCFIGQANNVLCYFNRLNTIVKMKLFKSYCSSFYGSELWDLNSKTVEDVCIAWRKGIRRIFNIPNNTHSFFIPIISDSLPLFDDLCKRSARFIVSCIFSHSSLVQSIAWHSIHVAKYNSPLGSNALFCCDKFGWSLDSFFMGLSDLSNQFFIELYHSLIPETENSIAHLLIELLLIRDGSCIFRPTNNFSLSKTELDTIISTVCTM